MYVPVLVFLQGFVTTVSHLRSFVPAIYNLTVAIPKTEQQPTLLRIFQRRSSVVSKMFSVFLGSENWESQYWISLSFSFVARFECLMPLLYSDVSFAGSCPHSAPCDAGFARIREWHITVVQRYFCGKGSKSVVLFVSWSLHYHSGFQCLQLNLDSLLLVKDALLEQHLATGKFMDKKYSDIGRPRKSLLVSYI